MYNLEKKVAMRDLSTDTIDQLVSIEGMITRVSELIPDLRIALFRCSVCHHVEEVRRDGYRVENPERCSNCQTPGSMVIDHNSGYFVDKQLVKMQEVPDQVPEDVKRRRVERLVDLQSGVMDAWNEARLGTVMEVLCEGFDPDMGCWAGRTYADSVDVDGHVYFTAGGMVPAGSFVNVRITGTADGDLTGEIEE